jgi:hypothetical protein
MGFLGYPCVGNVWVVVDFARCQLKKIRISYGKRVASDIATGSLCPSARRFRSSAARGSGRAFSSKYLSVLFPLAALLLLLLLLLPMCLSSVSLDRYLSIYLTRLA